MEILDGNELNLQLLSKYSKDPRGWSFVISPARRFGFFDAMVSSPKEAWQLKIDSIFKPNPLVMGVPTEVDPGRMSPFSAIPYGYRRLEERMLAELLKGAEEDSDGSGRPAGRTMDLLSFFARETVVPRQGGSYAQGPFVFTGQKAFEFSGSQKGLDDRLTTAMSRLMQKRYPGYG